MDSVEAMPLERAQVPSAARLLARALFDDSAYAAILSDADTREARLERFFAGHLANHVPHRCSYADTDGDGVRATVTVRPPGGIQVPGVRLAAGLARLALACGPGIVRRMLAVRDVYEALEQRSADGAPYWHVHMMAVRPELQGKGIGGALLREALGACARSPAPIVLTTHKAINVRFYLREGFRVTHEEQVAPTGAAPYTVWCMRRDAGSA